MLVLVSLALSLVFTAEIFLPQSPLQIAEHNETTYNILVVSLMTGSPKKIIDAIAIDLSKTTWPSGVPMFNVTILTSQHRNKKLLSQATSTFHPFPLDYKPLKHYLPPTKTIREGVKKHENKMVDELIYKQNPDVYSSL